MEPPSECAIETVGSRAVGAAGPERSYSQGGGRDDGGAPRRCASGWPTSKPRGLPDCRTARRRLNPSLSDTGQDAADHPNRASAAPDRPAGRPDLAVSPATISRVLRQHGLSRIRDLEPPAPVQRYERKRPGEMIHIDIEKLGHFERVGHRLTGERTGAEQRPRDRMGVPAPGRRRSFPAGLFRDHPDEKRGPCLVFRRATLGLAQF